jgi:hypothetical protein
MKSIVEIETIECDVVCVRMDGVTDKHGRPLAGRSNHHSRESRFPTPNRSSACIRTFAVMLVCLRRSPYEPRLTYSMP